MPWADLSKGLPALGLADQNRVRYAGADPFAGLSSDALDFYNDGQEGSHAAYDAFLRALGLTNNQKRYAQGLFGEVNRAFGAYALNQKDPTSTLFTDWLSNGGSQSFIDQYNALSASDRGFNVGRFNGGRLMF